MSDGPIGRILVVDDEEDVRMLLRAALGDAGYEVVTAADGEEAIEVARRRRPDLILLDLMMPRVSGWTFTERYAREPGPHAPIIVLSAVSGQVVRLPERGVERIIPKPFSVDLLLRHIERAIARRS
ncbi:MAG: response regulator [Chloroflexota bacterium]